VSALPQPEVRLAGVAKRFTGGAGEVEVLRGVDLELAAGESLAVTGPSGSGKSTLLHVIGTLDRPSAGTVEVAGERPFELPNDALARFRNRTVGFVFQEHYLLPQYSVLENVLVPALAFRDGARDPAVRERARELVDRVGLGHRLEHRPAELSGGERQRVAVARALVMSPRLVLCDEPTGSLDRATAGDVAGLLHELHRRERTVLVVVTHSEELAATCARHATLDEGRLVEGGTAAP
jgi:lipoprotein-releasing system ATP-binding protein